MNNFKIEFWRKVVVRATNSAQSVIPKASFDVQTVFAFSKNIFCFLRCFPITNSLLKYHISYLARKPHFLKMSLQPTYFCIVQRSSLFVIVFSHKIGKKLAKTLWLDAPKCNIKDWTNFLLSFSPDLVSTHTILSRTLFCCWGLIYNLHDI